MPSTTPALPETCPDRSIPWLPAHMQGERNLIFLAYVALLGMANIGFTLVSWLVQFGAGFWLHLLGTLVLGSLAAMRLQRLAEWPGQGCIYLLPAEVCTIVSASALSHAQLTNAVRDCAS